MHTTESVIAFTPPTIGAPGRSYNRMKTATPRREYARSREWQMPPGHEGFLVPGPARVPFLPVFLYDEPQQ